MGSVLISTPVATRHEATTGVKESLTIISHTAAAVYSDGYKYT